MKKIISVIFAALLAIPFFCKASSAAAPPKKDGVVFSGSVSSGKRIALTFDDGPHPTKTKEILDILDKYDVKATFFIIGVNAERYPEIIADEAARRHELANHSYSHKNLSKICDDKIKEEIEKSKYEVIGCRYNNEYFNLNKKIEEDAKIELIDISDKEGAKIYRMTLVYIMGKAFESLYPKEKLTVEYQLGDAMFCKCDNVEITAKFTKELKEKMQEIIEKDLKIEQRKMTRI